MTGVRVTRAAAGSDEQAPPSDSAGDGVLCGDRREAASVDTDTDVTASDMGRVASKFGTYSLFDHAKRRLDFNRDGNITAGDLGSPQRSAPVPRCYVTSITPTAPRPV
jgi:hypothetical protein